MTATGKGLLLLLLLLLLPAVVAEITARSPCARAQGLLEKIAGEDPWAMLSRPGARNREQGLRLLVRTGDRALCDPIYRLFEVERKGTQLRPQLLTALGALGCRGYLPHLRRQARSTESAPISRAAIEALGRLRDPGTLDALEDLVRIGHHPLVALDSLERFGDPGLRRIQGLMRLGGPPARRAAILVARSCRPDSARIIRRAWEKGWLSTPSFLAALGEAGDPGLQPEIFPFLFGPDSEVQGAALAALGATADGRAVGPLLASLADPKLRQGALKLLGRLEVEAPVTPLLTLLGDKKRLHEELVIMAIGRLGRSDAVRPLARLASDGAPELQASAVDALQHTRAPLGATVLRRIARRGGPLAPRAILRLGSLLRGASALPRPFGEVIDEARRDLLRLSRSPSASLRHAALVALGRMGEPTGQARILEALREGSPADRRAAVTALAYFEEDEAERALSRAAAPGADPAVRAAALWTLGRTRSPLAAPLVLRALGSGDRMVAINAAAALGRLRVPRLAPEAALHLDDARPLVRANLALSLAHLGYHGARARLRRLAGSDSSPAVRRAACQAMATLRGEAVRQELRDLRSRELDPDVGEAIGRLLVSLPAGGRCRRPLPAGRWVDFRLERARGKPLPWRTWVARLPDGSHLAGVADGQGWGFIEPVPPGVVHLKSSQRVMPPPQEPASSSGETRGSHPVSP